MRYYVGAEKRSRPSYRGTPRGKSKRLHGRVYIIHLILFVVFVASDDDDDVRLQPVRRSEFVFRHSINPPRRR